MLILHVPVELHEAGELGLALAAAELVEVLEAVALVHDERHQHVTVRTGEVRHARRQLAVAQLHESLHLQQDQQYNEVSFSVSTLQPVNLCHLTTCMSVSPYNLSISVTTFRPVKTV